MAALSGIAQEVAVEQFVAALLGNESVMPIETVACRIEDMWVSDDLSKTNPHKSAGEVITYRFSDGTPWQPSV